jgi:uncharacterized LabA/DUF88 family protein
MNPVPVKKIALEQSAALETNGRKVISSQKVSPQKWTGNLSASASPTQSISPIEIDKTPVQFDAANTERGRLIILIDGSNLFYAALQLGIEIDYANLLHCLSSGGQLIRALFYTGVDPDNDKQQGFLNWMGHNGYRVITKKTTQLADGSKKGNLDVEIAVDMMRLASCCDTIILVSGDGDFAYAVQHLLYQGVRVEVVGLRSMTSISLINVADYYVDLGSLKREIQRL